MPIMQKVLLYIPSGVLGLLIVSVMTALSIAGLVIVRQLVPHHKMRVHHDVAGPIFCTLGVIYAVLLSLVTVMVLGQFDKSRQGVDEEANCLVALYRATDAFSQEFKEKIRLEIKNYITVVVNEEWKTLKRGEGCAGVDKILQSMWSSYVKYTPKPGVEQIFFDESIHKLELLEQCRATRIVDSRTGLPILIWVVLFIGGMTTIMFTFFFGVENFKAQAVMATLLVVTIALMLFTIMCLDYPFTGSVSVSPEAFKQIEMTII